MSELPFEWYDLLIIVLIIFTLYQLGKRMNQFTKMIIEDYPRLKVKEKNILFMSRLFFSFLILLIVLFIIGDLFFDITRYFFAIMDINNEPLKYIKIIKYFLVLILKPLLILINYRSHGVKSWRFWVTIISSIFFVNFLMISFSGHWNLTIYQEISAFIITLFLSLVSLTSFGELGICNMVPSTQNIPAKDENLGKGKNQKDNSDEDKNNSNNGNKRKDIEDNLDDNKPRKKIVRLKFRDPDCWDDWCFYVENWSPDALKNTEYEIRNTIDKERLIQRIERTYKTLEDIKSVQAGRPVEHNYFNLENLRGLVSIEKAKAAFEREHQISLDVLNKIKEDEWLRLHRNARNKHFDYVTGDNRQEHAYRRVDTYKYHKSLYDIRMEKYKLKNSPLWPKGKRG